jgi:hypothetical protein
MELLSEVFGCAVRTVSEVDLARQVLARIDSSWLSVALPRLINEVLDASDVTWAEYRRIAEMLEDLGQHQLLEQLASRALLNGDPDIVEVGSDFRRAAG